MLRLAPKPGERALLFHDVHFPIHDPGCMALVVEAAQVLGCSVAIADGDIFDASSLSSHRRDAKQALTAGWLEAEAEAGKPYLQAIRVAVPYCIFKRGNHEERVQRLVDDVPALYGMEWWEPFRSALDGWDCLPGDAPIRLGSLLVGHGHELAGSIGANPARRVLAAYPGQNTYFGHCHQVDQATTPTSKNGRPVIHGAWTGGHLSDPEKQAYALATRHRWQQGFAVVEFWDAGLPRTAFTVHLVRIFRDSRGLPVARVLGRTLRG